VVLARDDKCPEREEFGHWKRECPLYTEKKKTSGTKSKKNQKDKQQKKKEGGVEDF